jgi:broad specificity phosphatase PhoE
MSEILFIRHAETDMAGTFCGHSNPPLNMRGRNQLSELLSALNSESIDEIYASDLLRARETGETIAEARAIKCHLRPTLREINFGQWEVSDGKKASRGTALMRNVGSPNILTWQRRTAKASMTSRGVSWWKYRH